MMVVKIIVAVKKILMANIYRPPCPDIITFLDEQSELEDFMVTTGGYPIFVSNINYTGLHQKVSTFVSNLDVLF